MRWERGHRSDNVEDRRGRGSGPGGSGIRLGLGGIAVLAVLSLLTGQNFFALLGDAGPASGGGQPAPEYRSSAAEDELVQFVSFVLDDVQDTWRGILPRAAGRPYEDARLVLFTDAVQSGCGGAQAAMGPFYCPADTRAYIDLGFYHDLRQRFGAPGDFAQAYVLAHEIGHHVQNLLGIAGKVHALRQRDPARAAALQVRMELQADCFAGVWAHSTQQRRLLEAGDVEEAMTAAAAVGDDRLQRQATGRVTPETWTHGSSAQRAAWFQRGFGSGDPRDCDTFAKRIAQDGDA
ncbi:MAG: neutral zinc metallopeptidase [Gammaproteobacteria bacterium]